MNEYYEAIVMDVDQVLLDHLSRFREYVNRTYGFNVRGLPEKWDATEWLGVDSVDQMLNLFSEFSESFEFGTLDAFPGSDVNLHELMQDGYKLICITACGSSHITQALRKVNLFHRFGNIFEELHFVNFNESKTDKLLDISSRFDIVAFIDDKPANIEDALYGANIENVILMKAPHNREFRKNNVDIPAAFTWYECTRFIDEFTQDD